MFSFTGSRSRPKTGRLRNPGQRPIEHDWTWYIPGTSSDYCGFPHLALHSFFAIFFFNVYPDTALQNFVENYAMKRLLPSFNIYKMFIKNSMNKNIRLLKRKKTSFRIQEGKWMRIRIHSPFPVFCSVDNDSSDHNSACSPCRCWGTRGRWSAICG